MSVECRSTTRQIQNTKKNINESETEISNIRTESVGKNSKQKNQQFFFTKKACGKSQKIKVAIEDRALTSNSHKDE